MYCGTAYGTGLGTLTGTLSKTGTWIGRADSEWVVYIFWFPTYSLKSSQFAVKLWIIIPSAKIWK